MALDWYPKYDAQNTEAAFAQYIDRIFSAQDHVGADTHWALVFDSVQGSNHRYRLESGDFLFDGYVFHSDGTTTIDVATSSVDIYFYYTLTAGVITACGLSTSSSAGSARIKLFNTNAMAITDYRRVFTWGKYSVASSAVDATVISAAREKAASSYSSSWNESVVTSSGKRFRVAYNGSVRLTAQIKSTDGTTTGTIYRVYRVRAGAATLIASLNVGTADTYTAVTADVTGLLPGDYIDIQPYATSSCSIKDALMKYTLEDPASSQAVLD